MRVLDRKASLGAVLLAAAIALAAGVSPGVPAAEDSSSVSEGRDTQAFEDLLDVTGVFVSARSVTDTMVQRLQRENPVVPADVWSRFAAKISDRATLAALYVPIYARHLSEVDARGVVQFYATPTGEHLLHATPLIQQECRASAQVWVAEVAAELTGDSAQDRRRPASVGVKTARDEAIHEALRASGAIAQARQMMSLMIERIKQTPQASELPASFWQQARDRLTNEADLLRLWTPAYAHHLSEGDIRGIIEFYRSPLGARYVAALPAIQSESVEAATQLANNSAHRAIHEVLGPLPQWRLQHPQSEPEPR
jgi:hypothetical protein